MVMGSPYLIFVDLHSWTSEDLVKGVLIKLM